MTRLIAATSFGEESKTYIHCQPLARFYRLANNLTDAYEISANSELRPGETHVKGDRFITGNLIRNIPLDTAWSEKRPQWSSEQCINQIGMLCEFFRFLLKNYNEPFWLYFHTLTSLVHWPSIYLFVDKLPCEKIFAGKPLVLSNHLFEKRIKIPSVGTGPYMLGISGAGFLMSSDLVAMALDRQHQCTHHIPNDVWLSIVLADIPRIPLARRDLFASEAECEKLIGIISCSDFIKSDVSRGNFHFRVNSLGRLANPENRHLYDPKILAVVAARLLATKESSLLHRQAGLEEAAGFLQHFQKNPDSTFGSRFITHAQG